MFDHLDRAARATRWIGAFLLPAACVIAFASLGAAANADGKGLAVGLIVIAAVQFAITIAMMVLSYNFAVGGVASFLICGSIVVLLLLLRVVAVAVSASFCIGDLLMSAWLCYVGALYMLAWPQVRMARRWQREQAMYAKYAATNAAASPSAVAAPRSAKVR